MDDEKKKGPFRLVKVFMPNGIYNMLKAHSKDLSLPMTKLTSIALDKEMRKGTAFEYELDFADTLYIEFAYAEEAAKITRYMLNFPIGTGRDTIMLHRFDIGVPDPDRLLAGLKELLESEILEEIKPPRRTKFKYKEGYRYIRLKKIPDDTKAIEKKRKLIDKMQKELNKMEGLK